MVVFVHADLGNIGKWSISMANVQGHGIDSVDKILCI